MVLDPRVSPVHETDTEHVTMVLPVQAMVMAESRICSACYRHCPSRICLVVVHTVVMAEPRIRFSVLSASVPAEMLSATAIVGYG